MVKAASLSLSQRTYLTQFCSKKALYIEVHNQLHPVTGVLLSSAELEIYHFLEIMSDGLLALFGLLLAIFISQGASISSTITKEDNLSTVNVRTLSLFLRVTMIFSCITRYELFVFNSWFYFTLQLSIM